MNCRICGKSDLFSEVAQKPVCAICAVKFIGGLPATSERIEKVRALLGLKDGEFLKQDNAKEAKRILGR